MFGKTQNIYVQTFSTIYVVRTDFTYLKCEDAIIERIGLCLMLISDTQGVQEWNQYLIQRKCEWCDTIAFTRDPA